MWQKTVSSLKISGEEVQDGNGLECEFQVSLSCGKKSLGNAFKQPGLTLEEEKDHLTRSVQNSQRQHITVMKLVFFPQAE